MRWTRRRMLAMGPALAVGPALLGAGGTETQAPAQATAGPIRTMQAQRAELLPSRHRRQVEVARQNYMAVSDEDLLHGFRKLAGKAAPGKSPGGWCTTHSGVIFGQVVSGLARLGAYLGDNEARDKAIRLFAGWRETVGESGDAKLDGYSWDKLVCGIVDLKDFAGHDAFDYLSRSVEWASKTFSRARSPAGPDDWDGRNPGGVGEWYTLGENLYRAYGQSGEAAYRDFADVWNYPAFWDLFADFQLPTSRARL